MVGVTTNACPKCGGLLQHIGSVRRLVITKGGKRNWIKVRRLQCKTCKMVHRELPSYVLPFKHYHAGIIKGVLNGQISMFDLDYEDYPSEMTMKRWKTTRNKHLT